MDSVVTAPDRRSAIAHRPLPCFFLVLLLPQPSQHRAPPDTHRFLPCHWMFRPRTASAYTHALVLTSALHRSLFAPCVIRLPLHRRVYRHSCVCVRTPAINLDLISPHAPYAPPPPPAPVLSCAPHSDPDLDLVQHHCCLRCVRDHRRQSPFLSSCGSAFVFVSRIEYCISHMYHIPRAISISGPFILWLQFSALRLALTGLCLLR
ncbi:hypothetical protein B0H13DRAFT_2324380 [Mycena leptocephala]|nr:hypothetical protein B0H13DRAFT_2324380 [Mycena leptocephala]